MGLLRPLLSPRALGEFAPGLTTEPMVLRKGYGDTDAAFAAAPITIELELVTGRHAGVPLETRGAIARYEAATDTLEIHGAAKVPHWNRDTLAGILGRAPSSVHFLEGHVGCAFRGPDELCP